MIDFVSTNSRGEKAAVTRRSRPLLQFCLHIIKMQDYSKEKIDQMIDLCDQMLEKSYCVYSRFPVASVLVTECDKIFTGCNVENSSYGLCICAERTAAVKAVSEGYRKFKVCFVKTRSDKAISPCGACRQFLAEFGRDMTIVLINNSRQHSVKKLSELLPDSFTKAELDSGVI